MKTIKEIDEELASLEEKRKQLRAEKEDLIRINPGNYVRAAYSATSPNVKISQGDIYLVSGVIVATDVVILSGDDVGQSRQCHASYFTKVSENEARNVVIKQAEKLGFKRGVLLQVGDRPGFSIITDVLAVLNDREADSVHVSILVQDAWKKSRKPLAYVRTDNGTVFPISYDKMRIHAGPVPPIVNKSQVIYTKGDTLVYCGCASISVQLLQNADKLLNNVYTGNRQAVSIRLSSSVELLKQNIKDILDYINTVNNNDEPQSK